jgi:transposase
MTRDRITDDQWECIKDLFPKPAKTGRPPRDHRLMLDGIFWILRTGSAWRDLPEEFGPWQTVYDRFNGWNEDGTIDNILQRLRAAHVDCGAIDDHLWCVDGTILRAHRCAAGGGKKTTRRNQLITH